MRFVATINNVRNQERIRIRKKNLLPSVQALQLDDNGHVWLINGEITSSEIKTLFRRGNLRPVKDENVTVYDAYEGAGKTLTSSIHERDALIPVVATFSHEQEGL